MKSMPPPISLAGSYLHDIRHVCAFFTSDEEEYRVLMPFIQEGLLCGDRAIHIVNSEERIAHLERLARAGIDTAAMQVSGQLQLQNNADAYLRDGRFDQDRMLATFEKMASGNAPGHFPLSRIVCRMDWVSGDPLRIQNVIEFESRVNDVWSRHDDAVICTYHLEKFGGDAVIDVLRTHPMVIIGGILQHNPFFTPPEQFLREYRERRAGRNGSPGPAA